MIRQLSGAILFGLLVASSMLFAEEPARLTSSVDEPPVAEPGEIKPAPDSVVVTPGQPRLLPKSIDQSIAADPDSAVKQAQFVTPATNNPSATPAVLIPEPAIPAVRISVKGMDTAPTGQELTYKLTATNTTEAKAHNVIVRCPVPRGAKLVKSLPQPNVEAKDKDLEWHLDTLDPRASRQIEVVFKPDDDTTEISVVAKVQIEHGRFVTTKIANPTLEMKKTGPPQGVLHDPMMYKIVVTNPGKVPVTDIQIVDQLAEGLEYVQETSNGAVPVSKVGPAPNQRTWTLGTLKPKETRTLEYRVMPRKTGEWISEAVATATGVQIKAGCNTVVQEAKIALQVSGPANEKSMANAATPYLVQVHNTGSATLHNLRVSCSFPAELRVAKASSGGQMFRDAVQWVLPKLGPNESKELSVSLIAPSAGIREIVVSARGDKGLEQRKKLPTSFEGIAALNWQTEGTAVAAPGQEIVYTITVKNPGSAPAKNVKIVADLPAQVEFRQAQPAFQRGQGGIFFNPIEIPAKETVTFKVVAVAKKAGEARFHFEMTAEGMSSGALKNAKATTISPGGEPKKLDPTRVGMADPVEEKKADPKIIIPTGVLNPVEPSSPPAP